jgi:hypothetical protein
MGRSRRGKRGRGKTYSFHDAGPPRDFGWDVIYPDPVCGPASTAGLSEEAADELIREFLHARPRGLPYWMRSKESVWQRPVKDAEVHSITRIR